MSIQIGDPLRLRTVRNYGCQTLGDRMISVDYTAPANEVFVVMLIGTEPKDPKTKDELLDLERAMKVAGWIRDPKQWHTNLPGDHSQCTVQDDHRIHVDGGRCCGGPGVCQACDEEQVLEAAS